MALLVAHISNPKYHLFSVAKTPRLLFRLNHKRIQMIWELSTHLLDWMHHHKCHIILINESKTARNTKRHRNTLLKCPCTIIWKTICHLGLNLLHAGGFMQLLRIKLQRNVLLSTRLLLILHLPHKLSAVVHLGLEDSLKILILLLCEHLLPVTSLTYKVGKRSAKDEI